MEMYFTWNVKHGILVHAWDYMFISCLFSLIFTFFFLLAFFLFRCLISTLLFPCASVWNTRVRVPYFLSYNLYTIFETLFFICFSIVSKEKDASGQEQLVASKVLISLEGEQEQPVIIDLFVLCKYFTKISIVW